MMRSTVRRIRGWFSNQSQLAIAVAGMGRNAQSTQMESSMNWDHIEGNWKQFKGGVKQKWGMLIDERLGIAAGKCMRLSGRIQE